VLDAYRLLDKEFLLLYGDNFWPPDLKRMYRKFKNKNALISTTIFNNKSGTAEYGKENNVYVRKDSFVKKYDKSRQNKNLNGVDIGFFIVKKKFLKFFQKKNKNFSFENDILIEAIKLKKLIAYRTNKQYFSITNFEMLNKFEKISQLKKLNYIKK
jgi:D-glycero-D-manno-heptose 1,7-bisphosphate phosphatase